MKRYLLTGLVAAGIITATVGLGGAIIQGEWLTALQMVSAGGFAVWGAVMLSRHRA